MFVTQSRDPKSAGGARTAGRLMILVSLVVVSGAVVPPAGAGTVVDQHDPVYQKMMEHLDAARQAMARADAELSVAEQNNVLPGLGIDRMRRDLADYRSRIEYYLMPRNRRLDVEQLKPDGVYFRPPEALENPARSGMSQPN